MAYGEAQLPRPPERRKPGEGGREESPLLPSMGAVPRTPALARRVGLPVGAQISPLAPDVTGQAACISQPLERCARCRAYAARHVALLAENGRTWSCCLCGMRNDCPTSWLGFAGRARTPELTHGALDAPLRSSANPDPSIPLARGPFAVRKRAVLAFDANHSSASAASGALHAAFSAANAMLDAGLIFSSDCCGTAGVLSFSRLIRFYSPLSNEEIEVPDVDTSPADSSPHARLATLCPEPSRVLCSDFNALKATLRYVETDVEDNVVDTTSPSSSAFNGLRCAIELASAHAQPLASELGFATYGHAVLFISNNANDADISVESADKLAQLACARNVRVDVFVLGQERGAAVHSLERTVRATGGELHWYTPFQGALDTGVLLANAERTACNTKAYNVALTLRTARGLRLSRFLGAGVAHEGVLTLSALTEETAIGCLLEYNDTLTGAYIPMQAATAYIDPKTAEERVIVHTIRLHIGESARSVFDGIQGDVALVLLTRRVVSDLLHKSFESMHQARSELVNTLLTTLTCFRNVAQREGVAFSHKLVLPSSMLLMPLYTNSVLKLPALNEKAGLRGEDALWAFRLLTAGESHLKSGCWYPRLMSIRSADPVACAHASEHVSHSAGDENEPGTPCLPTCIYASAGRLEASGIYMLEDGWNVYLRIGRSADASDLFAIFGVKEVASIDSATTGLPPPNNSALSISVHGMLSELCHQRGFALRLRIVCRGDAVEDEFNSRLVEDRNAQGSSYEGFNSALQRGVTQKIERDATGN